MLFHLERYLLMVLFITVVVFISSCGGSGGGNSGSADTLEVDAGPPLTLTRSEVLVPNPTVLIDGMPASDSLSYQWRQIAGPGAVTITDNTIASPEITFSAHGSYQLLLEVSDQERLISDRLLVTVNREAAGPPGLTSLPVNTTQCVAPADVSDASLVQLFTPYPDLPVLNSLVGLYQSPQENDYWYALQQSGQVVRFLNDQAVERVEQFIDISDRVDYAGEKGLLGMAFHPDYANNGFVYLSYTASPDTGLESRISRFTLDAANQTLDPASEQIVLTVAQPYANHNGGQIAFGPDGMLYIGLGDGGSGGDPLGHGQNPMTLLGSMLRIDVGDGLDGYAIPADNPFVSGGGAGEVYAYGLRNPWRWSFDRQTGELWLGDVGQGAYEEVDIVIAGGNYGWNRMEGRHCYPASSTCDEAGLTMPVAEYDHTEGVAVTGGYVYRGNDLPSLQGAYLYGDYGSGKIWRLTSDGVDGYRVDELLDTDLNISSFAQDRDGELYVLHLGGTIYKLAVDMAGSAEIIPASLSGWGCFESSDVERFSQSVVPYHLNSLLWTDYADKERFMAIPDGSQVSLDAEGRFVFPPGSVLGKHFRLNGALVETRLLMYHASSGWRGYSYEWNDSLTDAVLLTGAKEKVVGDQTWYYPSSTECLLCHTTIAGIALGPELGQMNRIFPYTEQQANQLITYEAIGFFNDPLTHQQKSIQFYPIDEIAYSAERRARSYLHSNCAMCHQPGGPGGGSLDLRLSARLIETGLCNQAPSSGDLGLNNPVLLKPGDPDSSILVLRMERLDETRMPPLGSNEIDSVAASVIREWISGLEGCEDTM